MSSLPSQQKNKTPFTIVDLPLALLEFDFDSSINKKESIFLTFLALKYELAKRKGVTDNVLRQVSGSRFRSYLDLIVQTGINPMTDYPAEELGKYWFRCESAKNGYKKLMEFVGAGGK